MSSLKSKLRNKAYAARHKGFVRALSGIAPYFVVNEYPKSGGTWLAQMLSDMLDLPFRRNEPIRFERSVTHGHFLSPLALRNVVVLWRDPRDVLVSFYYHSYFVNEHHNARLVALMKERHPFDDYDDIQTNLPHFIANLSDHPVSPKFTWIDFARIWAARPGTVQTTYEALRANTAGELVRVVKALTGSDIELERAQAVVDEHSFARVKAKAEVTKTAATQMSFVREGSLGGWRRHFSAQAYDALEQYGYNDAMARVGYAPADMDTVR